MRSHARTLCRWLSLFAGMVFLIASGATPPERWIAGLALSGLGACFLLPLMEDER